MSASFKVSGDASTGALDFEAKAAASAGVGAGFGMEGTLHLRNIAGMAKRVGTELVGAQLHLDQRLAIHAGDRDRRGRGAVELHQAPVASPAMSPASPQA